jgi:hypothetical protein
MLHRFATVRLKPDTMCEDHITVRLKPDTTYKATYGELREADLGYIAVYRRT